MLCILRIRVSIWRYCTITYISSLFDSGVNSNTIRVQTGHEDEKTSLNNYCFDQKDESEREGTGESG